MTTPCGTKTATRTPSAPDTRARANAGVGPVVLSDVLIANLRASGVSALLAQPGDRLIVALWHELGCGVDAHGASPTALAHRVTCARPASAPAVPLALPSSHLAVDGKAAPEA